MDEYRTTGMLTQFNPDTERIEIVGTAGVWPVRPDEESDQQYSGIVAALDNGVDLVITDETLAKMGYVKQA